MKEIELQMSSGVSIVVPASFRSITTYVILEQEKWFEKKVSFLADWLRPGMNVIDVGANLGVYCLPIARWVGPTGHVYAYEPASSTSRLLRMSKKTNELLNLEIVEAALSDHEGSARLTLAPTSELNSLNGEGPGEIVRVTSLDAEDSKFNFGAIDFLKIDAEGEEEKILTGAKDFFAKQSPLVMFEVKSASAPNNKLLPAFAQMGFGLYRLLGASSILVRVRLGEVQDDYELNLFAAKPDRAAELAGKGLLVEKIINWTPDEKARVAAIGDLKSQPFASKFSSLFASTDNERYLDVLSGFSVWRSQDKPAQERVSALQFSLNTLLALCDENATIARLSTLARISSAAGRRVICVRALGVLADTLKRGIYDLKETFWPADENFDAILPGSNTKDWFMAAVLAQYERSGNYSSTFGSATDFEWLCSQPGISSEMERRRALKSMRQGNLVVPERLLHSAADHLNAAAWHRIKSGGVSR